ncbi:MAG: hypothetical protein DRQ49_18145 [Gammaproteobacteria bacterium]|nr:MAG: hypothetical protein DRQ49_18145 [Gammaproteobacteria bacterium]
MDIELTWEDFKILKTKKRAVMQFYVNNNKYMIWFNEGDAKYFCKIRITYPAIDGSDQKDFEDNYKDNCNLPIEEKNNEYRKIIMTTSRPSKSTTYFTSSGDKITEPQEIGAGKSFFYDFSNLEDEVSAPAGCKRKQIDFQFIDSTWIKEGTIYFHGAKKGSYVDLFVVCPGGEYYIANDGTPTLATGDTVVEHFCNKLFIQGDCPMGDELNTESCSQEIPSTYKYRIEITVPDSDTDSNGYCNLELYRKRTVILE